MNSIHAKFVFGVVLIFVLSSNFLSAQDGATLTGTVTDSFGNAMPGASLTLKSSAAGVSLDFQSDSTGHYSLPNLQPGDYEVSASVESLMADGKLTIKPNTQPTFNLTLIPSMESYPDAPSSAQTGTQTGGQTGQKAPSLEDLGFPKAESQADAQRQALLDKRTHMLKIHQRMGLITTIPMIASVVTSINAGGKSEGTASRDLHVALGALTGDLYGITAYYAIRAPRIPGTETRGPIKVHKVLAWIHGPGMILTPILGAMAFSQKNNGEKVHGIASAHGPVAIVTAGAFGAALLSVSLKF